MTPPPQDKQASALEKLLEDYEHRPSCDELVAAVRAEREALRQALKDIDTIICNHKRGAAGQIQHLARRALKGNL